MVVSESQVVSRGRRLPNYRRNDSFILGKDGRLNEWRPASAAALLQGKNKTKNTKTKQKETKKRRRRKQNR